MRYAKPSRLMLTITLAITLNVVFSGGRKAYAAIDLCINEVFPSKPKQLSETVDKYTGDFTLRWTSEVPVDFYHLVINGTLPNGAIWPDNLQEYPVPLSYKNKWGPGEYTWKVRGVKYCLDLNFDVTTIESEWSDPHTFVIEDWVAQQPKVENFTIADLKQTDPQSVKLTWDPVAVPQDPRVTLNKYLVFIHRDVEDTPQISLRYEVDKRSREITIYRDDIAQCADPAPCLVKASIFPVWSLDNKQDPLYNGKRTGPLIWAWSELPGQNNDGGEEVAIP